MLSKKQMVEKDEKCLLTCNSSRKGLKSKKIEFFSTPRGKSLLAPCKEVEISESLVINEKKVQLNLNSWNGFLYFFEICFLERGFIVATPRHAGALNSKFTAGGKKLETLMFHASRFKLFETWKKKKRDASLRN